jgi:hypothetical protein
MLSDKGAYRVQKATTTVATNPWVSGAELFVLVLVQ